MRNSYIVAALLLAPACVGRLGAQSAPRTYLDSVAIVASRAQAGSAGRSVDIITRDDIARSPAHNLAELLGARLSVDAFTRSPAQADISIRGATAEQLLILVDGVRMGDAQSAHYALDLGIPLSAIERIEILRGPGSALYGPNAIGGVINIVTRGATLVPASGGGNAGSSATASLYTGSFGTLGFGGFGDGGIGATSLSGAVQFDKSDGHRPDTDYRIFQSRIGADRRVGTGTLATAASVGVRDFGASNFYSPFNSSERTGTTTGDAQWTGPMGPWTFSAGAQTRLHTDRFTLVRGNPSLYENRHRSWQTGAEVTARTALGGSSTIVLGSDAEYDQLSSARLGGRREWRGALFVEDALRIGSRVRLTAGARDDHASGYGDFLSPSLVASLSLSHDLTLRASGSRGIRSPTWTERYYVDPDNIGNPAVKPERFWNSEAGATYEPSAARQIGLKWDVAGFVRRADNLIDWVRPTGTMSAPWQIENVGTATFHGIESSISASPTPQVTLALRGSGIMFSDAAAAGLTGKYALEPITRQIMASASLPLLGPGRMDLDLVHAKRAAQASYTTSNVRLTWPVQNVRMFLDGTNLANASWYDASGEVAQGRAVFVGVDWRN